VWREDDRVVAGADPDQSTMAARAGDARPGLQPVTRFLLAIASLLALAACEAGPPPATPPITPGTSAAPREVNIIAKDWVFLPDRVDVVPGETVLFHVINGGLDIHEAVLGNAAVQGAWEIAEAATVGSPPGPTPLVSVPPDVAGLRVVVGSGQRVDVTWTAPPQGTVGLVVGCHIPGHWAKGMVVPINLVEPSPHG
jgi:uncharacterized cupredoxin-like copper-binding protein